MGRPRLPKLLCCVNNRKLLFVNNNNSSSNSNKLNNKNYSNKLLQHNKRRYNSNSNSNSNSNYNSKHKYLVVGGVGVGVGGGGSIAGQQQDASKSSSSISGTPSVTSPGLDIISGLSGLGLNNNNNVPDGGSVGSASHHKRSMSGDVNSLLGNNSNSNNNNSNSTTTNGNGTNANPAGGGAATVGSSSGSGSGGTTSTTGILQESFATLPQSNEHDRTNIRSNSYTPQNPYPATPASYPTQPNAIFENPAIFEKLGTDALFYIFYYKQGSYQQYLAARELKKQSWRFHKKYMTWFQRHEEPKVTTDEYEQGTYLYFDWETGWCTRIKQDFRFEYSFLEDTLQ